MRVLIVEDEALIAMMAEDMIEALGCTIVATAANVADALEAVDGLTFDVALLDVNLNGANSMGIATALTARGKPFVFTTGYGAGGIAEEHRGAHVITKPYTLADLSAALATCQAAGTSSTTSSTDSKRG